MREKEMSFWDHLEEFRWTIIRIIIAVSVLTVVGLIIMPKIFDSVILAPRSSDFITYRILENASKYIPFMPDFSGVFNVKILNINMITQFMTIFPLHSLPFFSSLILYEIWRFVSRLCMKMK